MLTDYYQIFENRRPLRGHAYQTKREARAALRGLIPAIITSGDPLGIKIEQRIPHIPVYSMVGFRKVYGDDSIEHVTYLVRRVTLTANY